MFVSDKRVGPVTFYRLLERFGSPSEALAAVPKLSTRGGQPPLAPPSFEAIDAERQALGRLGGMFLFSCDARYPDVLRHVSDPPPVLSLLGNVDVINTPQVAIVGARNASANGIRMTTGLATDLGQAGFVITSGMARGIDTAAHNASLATGTVAVVGEGGHYLSTRKRRPVPRHSINRGAVVSEMPLGSNPLPKLPTAKPHHRGSAMAPLLLRQSPQRQSDYGTFGDRVWAGSHGRSWLTVG